MYRKLLMTVVMCLASLGCAGAAGAADAAESGQKCGQILIFHASCDAGFWCQMPSGQCADSAGTCEKVPEICNEIFQPVCGCNGQTFSNDCERRMSRVSKAHDGRCH